MMGGRLLYGVSCSYNTKELYKYNFETQTPLFITK